MREKMKCLVPSCKNHTTEGHGQFIECVDNWTGEKTSGWICQPCFETLTQSPHHHSHSALRLSIVREYVDKLQKEMW